MAIQVMLSGLPGRMCREIASLAAEPHWREKIAIAEVGFGEPSRAGEDFLVPTGGTIRIESVASLGAIRARLRMVHGADVPLVAIDFTTPDVAMDNLTTYCLAGVPFVMGTTGFDRERAVKIVESSGNCAVIAPNMAAPIVLVQTALRDLAARFPGALSGYSLQIEESHQATKRDTSGTAKALLAELRALGAAPADPAIVSIRDREAQKALGVPEEHLDGHAWHHYKVCSPGGNTELSLTHRVSGRRVYAEGALLAVEFLARCVASGASGKVYTMTDVLAEASP